MKKLIILCFVSLFSSCNFNGPIAVKEKPFIVDKIKYINYNFNTEHYIYSVYYDVEENYICLPIGLYNIGDTLKFCK